MHNKKKLYTILTVAAGVCIVLAINSCKKYLEPQAVSSFSSGYVFSNVQNATKAVLGAYQDMQGDNGYGIRISLYYAFDNDEMIGMHQTGDGDRGDIAHYTLNSSNGQLYAPWVQLYQGIERANECIYSIPRMPLYTTGSEVETGELQRLYGEALTLRAQYFLELIRNWGDVPAQFLPSSLEPNLFIGKTDRDTIYNHLLNDLLQAESLVPWRTDIAALGDVANERITLGAVKALRARIALYRGGYSLRRASSIYGQKMARPADYLTYYKIADSECVQMMARRDEHTLDPSYQAVFKNGFDAHTSDAFGEIVFEVGMSGGSGSNDSRLGYYDGNKVNSVGNAAIGVLPTYFYLFDSTDTRRDVTCAAYDVKADYATLSGRTGITLVEAKFRKEWMSSPSQLMNAGLYYGVDWPLIRFSDVLLMYAEAENEINQGPTAAGISAFEEVRKRGYGSNAALIGTTPTDYADFFNAVVKERSLEFGGEGIRKYDLIRWNLLGARLADAKTNLTNMAAKTGTFVGNYANNTLDFSQLPDSAFFKTTATIATGPSWGTSLYVPRTVSSISGYTKEVWMTATVANVLLATGSSNAYAIGFTPNHSELFPIPLSALQSDYNLTQDYGY
jgi:starch-binding outer membrane protein, SusD/RagB family